MSGVNSGCGRWCRRALPWTPPGSAKNRFSHRTYHLIKAAEDRPATSLMFSRARPYGGPAEGVKGPSAPGQQQSI